MINTNITKPKFMYRVSLKTVLDVTVQILIFIYIASYFTPEHLFSKTTITGGDTASHYYTAHYLKDYLLPHGKILGWMQGNFAGFPVFQFYFPLPFILMVLLSYLIGLPIAFKIISILGVFLLPVCTYYGFRLLGFRFPIPSLASLFTIPFLFMEANSMWGGNIPSTLAGEFTYSIGLALMVLFAGSCYHGIHKNRYVIRNGLLLAMIGFSHGYTLLFAGVFTSYFLLALPGFGKNLRYLLKVHSLAFCLMGFWIVPLLGYTTFTTRYNYIWIINSWREILPPVLWPGLVLAAVFTFYKLVRLVWPRWREPFDHRLGLLWYILGLSYLFYLVAFRIHVVDIRFLPFLQLYIVLLGALPIGLLSMKLKGGWLVLVILSMVTVLWTDKHVTSIRHWITWNYSGFESKPLWPAYSGVNRALLGTEADPRVVYEHSADHNTAGTVRAFESLPFFSGRNTLEGLYMQSSISAPFIFYTQSEISEVTSCPLPDYHCSTLNLQSGADHLRLFNVSDFIVRSDTVDRTIRNSPDFKLKEIISPYKIYRVMNNENRYVVPLLYQPVQLQTQDWKMDFYNWFKRRGTNHVHMVHLFNEDLSDESHFTLKASSLPLEIPKVPFKEYPQVTEKVSQEEIRITTSRIGHPLLVKISYHPRWQVEGADRIYLASPSFMLIFPTNNNVRLFFGDTPIVHFGHLLTILGLGVLLASLRPLSKRLVPLRTRISVLEDRLATTRLGFTVVSLFSWYDRHRQWMAVSIIFSTIVTTFFVFFLLQHTDASVLYNRGLEQFSNQHLEQAIPLFEKAMEQNPNSPSAINANYYLAICFFKQNQWQKTVDIFTQMITKYPDSIYIPEALYHIGLCLQNLGRKVEAQAKFETVTTQYHSSQWADHARTQLNAGKATTSVLGNGAISQAAEARAEYDAAIVLYDQHRLQESGYTFRAVVDKYPNDELADDSYMYYCFTLFRRGMYSQTIHELRIMISSYPLSPWIPEARYHLALSLLHLGQASQAVVEFKRILEDSPDSRWARFAKEKLKEIEK